MRFDINVSKMRMTVPFTEYHFNTVYFCIQTSLVLHNPKMTEEK